MGRLSLACTKSGEMGKENCGEPFHVSCSLAIGSVIGSGCDEWVGVPILAVN